MKALHECQGHVAMGRALKVTMLSRGVRGKGGKVEKTGGAGHKKTREMLDAEMADYFATREEIVVMQEKTHADAAQEQKPVNLCMEELEALSDEAEYGAVDIQEGDMEVDDDDYLIL
jgi:hypothetical protein